MLLRIPSYTEKEDFVSTICYSKHWVSIVDQLRVKWLVNLNPNSEMSINHLLKVFSAIGTESVCLSLECFQLFHFSGWESRLVAMFLILRDGKGHYYMGK